MNRVTVSDVQRINKVFRTELLPYSDYFNKSKRKLYFLAACRVFEPNIDLDLARKLCPYGGLIGISNSSLDFLLKGSKILRLHAVLHDAAGFVSDNCGTGPSYIYASSLNSLNSCFLGHVTGILFCLRLKFLHPTSFNELQC